MKVFCVDPKAPQGPAIEEAAAALQQGGLVAFPTETVYGLGADGLNGEACRRIYAAKGRPSDNPLILHIGDLAMLGQIAAAVPETAQKLMDAFWPGPMTLIFPKTEAVPLSVTGGLDTVAVRFPSHPVALALIRAAGRPIAAPSANTSGKPSPTRAAHVAEDLGGKIDYLLDGGPCDVGVESTIVDVSSSVPTLLRPGGITLEMLRQVVGRVDVDPAIMEKPAPDLRPKAPGMKYKHYAPSCPVILVRGTPEAVVAAVNAQSVGKRAGVLCTDETAPLYQAALVRSLGKRTDLAQVARSLFDGLRGLDEAGAEVIFCEVFPTTGEGLAVMNRLQKAAGYTFWDVDSPAGKTDTL